MSGTVKLGFSTSEAAISAAIRAAESVTSTTRHARVSHAFLTFPDVTLGTDVVLEAWWNGVIVRPFERAMRDCEVVALVDPIVPLEPGVQWIAKNYLGAPYDFGGLVGEVWVTLLKYLHKKASNPLHSAKALFCSDLCVVAMQHSGYPLTETLDAATVNPQELFESVSCPHELHDPLVGAVPRVRLLHRNGRSWKGER